jgi:hypothetical protein
MKRNAWSGSRGQHRRVWPGIDGPTH